MLKMHKRCTLINHIEFCFDVIHVVQCFPHIFYIISVHFSCENNMNPSFNAKHESLYYTKFEMGGLPSYHTQANCFVIAPSLEKGPPSFYVLEL
jgi:hypothetical protein